MFLALCREDGLMSPWLLVTERVVQSPDFIHWLTHRMSHSDTVKEHCSMPLSIVWRKCVGRESDKYSSRGRGFGSVEQVQHMGTWGPHTGPAPGSGVRGKVSNFERDESQAWDNGCHAVGCYWHTLICLCVFLQRGEGQSLGLQEKGPSTTSTCPQGMWSYHTIFVWKSSVHSLLRTSIWCFYNLTIHIRSARQTTVQGCVTHLRWQVGICIGSVGQPTPESPV